ncbi:hypothetical protein BDV12DRAFT_162231 [Aspergillus spectabilis]
MDPGSFPHFTDGDVKITVRPDIYHLQSPVIQNRSGYLRQLLQGRRVPFRLSKGQCNAPSIRVNLNLVGSSVHKYGMLEIQGYDDSFHGSDEMSPCSFPVWPQRTRHIWSNIFKIFYNLPPVLDDDGYDSILGNCQALVELGEELHSSDVVSRAIQTTLFGFDQQLYQLIAQDPASWVKLAVRIQSAPIFQESMIHLVGKWGLIEEKERESLPKTIRDLCNQKLHDLNAIKITIERQIVNHVPRPRSDSVRSRETNNVFVWMALTFYQQWLCQSFVESRNYRAPDGGATFYRAIAAGGDAYLNKLDQDISQFPAPEGSNDSNKGLKELERNLNELKKGIKGFVSDLLVNQAKYDPEILGELPYLTCCKVDEGQMPQAGVIEMDCQLQGVCSMNMSNNFADNNLQDTFLPGPMLNSVQFPTNLIESHDPTSDLLMMTGIQNNPTLDAFNTFTPQNMDSLIWCNSMDFAGTNPDDLIPAVLGMNDDLHQGQCNQDNNLGSMDMFTVSPITETDRHTQKDGDMAFI